jgi:hypothetical protein
MGGEGHLLVARHVEPHIQWRGALVEALQRASTGPSSAHGRAPQVGEGGVGVGGRWCMDGAVEGCVEGVVEGCGAYGRRDTGLIAGGEAQREVVPAKYGNRAG